LIIQAGYGNLSFGSMGHLPTRTEKGAVMKKTLAAVAAVAALATATMAPAPAEARNGRVAAGVAAGLLGGALIGGAIAAGSNPYYYGSDYSSSPGYAYGPGYSYGGAPAYVADPDPGYACYLQRQRVWDGYGWQIRRVRVCE
jgi:hypothetical protein